ncbi:MAG: hypothetical protein ACE5HB_07475 [Terriglobia bacterium]
MKASLGWLAALALAFSLSAAYWALEAAAARSARNASQSLAGGYLFTQPDTLRNSTATSGANAAQTVTIAAVAGQQVNLYSITVFASGAPTCTLNVDNGVGGTAIWQAEVTDATQHFRFQPALTNPDGAGMDVDVSACGVGVTSTLSVVASQFD